MQNHHKAAFHTLGCKLNFSETSVMARQLQENGFQKVEFTEQADIYVINTCSVTENADRECRVYVNRALMLNPNAFIAVTGCYAQLKPLAVASIPGVDLVLGATEKFNLPAFIHDLGKRGVAEILSCEIADVKNFIGAHSEGDRTRSFLKVQDGCDYSCSFCTIPKARGRSRSDTVENVLSKISNLAASGIREVVLTGVNLGDFGKAAAGEPHVYEFIDLAHAIEEMDVEIRVRISSIEPNLLSQPLIDLVSRSRKFMPHFHIPLQSGSDRILKLMKRRYLRSLYSDRISYIKTVMPHACIGADVITGFPGESDADFKETFDFISSLDISYLHVFTYSERNGTVASSMAGRVEQGVRKQRNLILRRLSDSKLKSFYMSQSGKTGMVLFESGGKDGMITGFTENYIRVRTPYDASIERSLQQIRLEEPDQEGYFNYRQLQFAE